MESKWLMYVVLTLFLLDGQWGQGCWDQERTALLQLKPFFTKPRHLRNWVRGEENSDCCQWEGVECNSTTGRVTTLNLNYTWFPDYWYFSFEDDFKSENPMYLNASLFLPFEELRSLNLAGNGIAGCIENEGFLKLSKKLSNLEILNLYGNLFNNSILPSLSELSSLRSLNLGYNKFPASNHANELVISSYVARNYFICFERLSKLRNLEILDLRYNWLNNSVLSSLSELQSLKSLYLIDNKFRTSNHADGFERLSNLKNLEILDLNYNMLNNSILSSLSELPSLKSLYLAENKFQDADGFERLSKLRNLEILNLRYNWLNSSVLSSLSELQSLKSLSLTGNEFQASNHANGFERLSKLRNLEILDLSYNMLNNCILSSLSELSSLKSLNLAESNLLASNYGFLKLSKKLSNLEILNLGGNFFNKSILPYLSELSSLKSLNLADNKLQAFNHVDGFEGFSKLRKLEILDLSYNMLNNSILLALSELSSLKFLYLAKDKFQASSHANADFEKLSRLGHLEGLDLSGMNFSYNILSYLASLPSLKFLFLGNGRITMNPSIKGFHNFSKVEELYMDFSILPTNFFHDIGALTSLKVLSLSGCGLSGTLTSQGLCELTHLQELVVDNNYLGGALPSCLANLTSLQILNLDSNKFSGDMALSPLNKLTSLYYLSLSDNHFQIPISLQPFFNHSKLKHIYARNNEFYIDTNIESLEPTFQLNTLVLSGFGDCRAFPNFLYSQFDLKLLDLSHLNVTGEFPIWLLKNNTRLNSLFLVNNSLFGPIELLAHSHMSFLDISKNFFDGNIPREIGAYLPSLQLLNISENSLSGSIPPSVGDMKLLDYLDLSHNNLFGGIPDELTMGCSLLRVLVLSKNNMQGQIFSEKFSLFQLEELHLDDNHFSGSIPKSLSTCSYLSSIDFSNNNLSGRIPSWMGNMPHLNEIIMPNNGIKGPIPVDFCQLQNLEILDLSNNNISGSLPACFSPGQINHVHLSKNRLEGSLTTQFCHSSFLVTLDLSDNQLSGNIPDCINMLGELSYLILKNNNVEGEIPIQLCKLQKLSLIDLSQNHLSGYIPSCLNITTFDEAYKVDPSIAQAPDASYAQPPQPISTNEPVHFTTKNVSYSYQGRLLTYMSGIDLSCNKLIGEIPHEIGHLSKIHVLNLSHNFLIGQIPSTFSNLEQIESLDLSYNNLSGKIPPQLVQLHYLSTFRVAYNNLSGKTPKRVGQFGTFDESCYQGNPLLCGEPMKSCSTTSPPPLIQEDPTQGGKDDGFIDMSIFYVSSIVSYIMVLITIAAVLYINPYWRRVWFYYTEMCFISSYYFIVDHLPKQFH